MNLKSTQPIIRVNKGPVKMYDITTHSAGTMLSFAAQACPADTKFTSTHTNEQFTRASWARAETRGGPGHRRGGREGQGMGINTEGVGEGVTCRA